MPNFIRVYNEFRRPGEFLMGRASDAVIIGIVAHGQSLVDGQVLAVDEAGRLVAHSLELDTDGALTTPIAGIIIGNWTEPHGDIGGVPYLPTIASPERAPLYPINFDELALPADATLRDAVRTALRAGGIDPD